jgi:hypothetical protein
MQTEALVLYQGYGYVLSISLHGRQSHLNYEHKSSLLIESKEDSKQGFESHPKTIPQYLHIPLTAVALIHLGKMEIEFDSIIWLC